MRLKFSIRGAKAVEKALLGIEPEARKAAAQGLKISAIRIHETAVKGIRKQSQGRRYGRHIASKPGDPPNVDTGRLINGVLWELDEDRLVAAVGTNVPYGPELEIGNSRTEARPWLAPAIRVHRRSIGKNFQLKLKGKR